MGITGALSKRGELGGGGALALGEMTQYVGCSFRWGNCLLILKGP